jgi:hypothetical protein
MRLFAREQTQTPVEAAEQDVAKARQRCDRLSAELQAAQSQLATSKAAASEAALAGDSNGLADLAEQIATQEAAASALGAALNTASGEVAAAIEQLANVQDAEQRSESIRELQGLVDQIQSAGLPFKAALRDLVGLLNRGGEISADARAVAGLFAQLEVDADQLLNTATVALGIYAKQIEGGTSRATLPRPPPAPVAIPAPTLSSVHPLFDVKWTDPSGMLRHAAAGWDIEVPVATAQRAIAAGICVACDDPRAIKARRERGSVNADLDRAVDLDQTNPTPPAPEPERWIRPFAAPKWQWPTGPSRPWIDKGQLW